MIGLMQLSFFLMFGASYVWSAGITTHIEGGERAAEFMDLQSQGINYRNLVKRHPDAFQAGTPYPDAYYSNLCFDGIYHDISEDSHWTPFMNATINYIRTHYPRPWDSPTEKLVVFLLAFVEHQVSDATFHSLGISEGFISTMGKVNYHGSFGAAHNDADFGGDVVNLYALDMDYIGLITKWYVPTDDLVGIYREFYGEERISADVIDNCTMILFLGRLGENLGVIELLYPIFASRSPFLLDHLQDYFLGGMDDMAVWTQNVWYNTVTMLDYGTEVCELPDNPIYIECNTLDELYPSRLMRAPQQKKFEKPHRSATFLRRIIEQAGLDIDDIEIERTERGMILSASDPLKRFLQESVNLRKKNFQENLNNSDLLLPSYYYDTTISYSRLGEAMLTGDMNNDGFMDLMIGAPGSSSSGNYQQGRVYIVYGSAEGLPSTNLTLDQDADEILEGPELNGRFGRSLAVVDLNRDGIADLAVGAPNAGSPSLDYQGEVYVYYGHGMGGIAPQPSVTISCTSRYCNLGWSLAGGDLNNDGFADLIIGAPFAPSSGEQRGFVGVLYTESDMPEREITDEDLDWKFEGDQDYQWLGYSVAVSVTSSGEEWLMAGAPTNRLCYRADCGFSQNDVQAVGKFLAFRSPLSDTPTVEMEGEEEFAQMAFSLTSGNYDGKDMAAVVSPTLSPVYDNLTQAGVLEFYDMSNMSSSTQPSFTFYGDREYGRFGTNVNFADVNRDETTDAIISAHYRSEDWFTGREEGRVYIFYGDNQETERCAEEADIKLTMGEEKSRFGSRLASVESNDKVQVVASAEHSDQGGRIAGRVAIFNF